MSIMKRKPTRGDGQLRFGLSREIVIEYDACLKDALNEFSVKEILEILDVTEVLENLPEKEILKYVARNLSNEIIHKLDVADLISALETQDYHIQYRGSDVE